MKALSVTDTLSGSVDSGMAVELSLALSFFVGTAVICWMTVVLAQGKEGHVKEDVPARFSGESLGRIAA